MNTTPLAPAERYVIALVGIAHGVSHFFQLVLPPLFPFLVDEFGVGYTELGAVMTLFFLTSGFGQPLAGFLVDRFGAPRILLTGLGIYVLAVAALASVQRFELFFAAMMLAALGNCVFHPADYAVLGASVPRTHLGRAFGIHTLGGNLGWAAAPVFMLTLTGLVGWRTAILAAAAGGALIWVMLWFSRNLLRDESAANGESAAPPVAGARVLFSPTVLLCFGYFALIAAALIAVQNFIAPILGAIHATPLTIAGTALTAFLIGASVGVVVGGIAADRSTRHVGVIAAGLAGSAMLLVAVGYVPGIGAVLIAVLAGAGFLSGVTTPSRDLLVRGATPPGATGRVFGFVYSGLDVGSALAPVSVGVLLDGGHPQAALWLIGTMLVLAIGTVVAIRGSTAPALPDAPA